MADVPVGRPETPAAERMLELLNEAREELWEFDKAVIDTPDLPEWKSRLWKIRVKMDALAEVVR